MEDSGEDIVCIPKLLVEIIIMIISFLHKNAKPSFPTFMREKETSAELKTAHTPRTPLIHWCFPLNKVCYFPMLEKSRYVVWFYVDF
jgi:hypothetical protein